jgi:hypothetical protein
MTITRLFKFILSGCLLLLALNISYSREPLDNRLSNEVVNYYFDMVLSSNYESACGLWEPSSLARTNRLGIEYENIGVKIDCTSPVIYDRDKLRKYIAQGVHSVAIIDSQVLRWKFTADKDTSGHFNVVQFYYTAKTDDYFWLITPQDYYARDWDLYQSRYFRFYVNPVREEYYNDIAAESLDRFVDRVAEKLSISPERLKTLEEMKIDYYLCKGTNEVDKLTGRRERGVYDPAADAIITTLMPHYHKVAMLLVNFKLQKLPLYTAPFLRQGLAAFLGGRWQRSPEVVCDFGAYILKYGILDVDSLFYDTASEDLNNGDISSPVGACLAEYLWNKLGMDSFFDLYRSLSGDYRHVLNLSAADIENQIADALGQEWDSVKSDFIAFEINDDKSTKGSIRPGDVNTNHKLINEAGLVISTSPEWLKIEYTAGKDEDPNISVLFDRVPEMEGKISMLLREQHPRDSVDRTFRYGIKLDKNEIGLYDYAANLIIAKYVDSFSSNTDYYDAAANKITAYLDIKLLHGILPGESEYTIIK